VPRLSADTWQIIRAEREATGAPFADLAAKHGVSAPAIFKRARAESWGDGSDVADVVRRKVNERVNGVNVPSPKQRAAAIDAAADAGADIIRKHQAEWAEHRERFGAAPEAGITLPPEASAEQRMTVLRLNTEAARYAELSAKMLKLRQEGERKSHGLERDPADMKVTVAKAVDYTKLADSTLEDIARAANPSAT
jgi:hypothetical protein